MEEFCGSERIRIELTFANLFNIEIEIRLSIYLLRNLYTYKREYGSRCGQNSLCWNWGFKIKEKLLHL